MAVVARMRVRQVTIDNWATEIVLSPEVPQPGSPHADEITAFYAATPAGEFKATIKNELAAEQFQPGKAFYITLTPIPEPEATDG